MAGAAMNFVVLSDRTEFGGETGAGLMRNRCAFTSRDMTADWAEAFTYAIVFGWDDASGELANKFRWDDELLRFLADAHKRFAALPDRSK